MGRRPGRCPPRDLHRGTAAETGDAVGVLGYRYGMSASLIVEVGVGDGWTSVEPDDAGEYRIPPGHAVRIVGAVPDGAAPVLRLRSEQPTLRIAGPDRLGDARVELVEAHHQLNLTGLGGATVTSVSPGTGQLLTVQADSAEENLTVICQASLVSVDGTSPVTLEVTAAQVSGTADCVTGADITITDGHIGSVVASGPVRLVNSIVKRVQTEDALVLEGDLTGSSLGAAVLAQRRGHLKDCTITVGSATLQHIEGGTLHLTGTADSTIGNGTGVEITADAGATPINLSTGVLDGCALSGHLRVGANDTRLLNLRDVRIDHLRGQIITLAAGTHQVAGVEAHRLDVPADTTLRTADLQLDSLHVDGTITLDPEDTSAETVTDIGTVRMGPGSRLTVPRLDVTTLEHTGEAVDLGHIQGAVVRITNGEFFDIDVTERLECALFTAAGHIRVVSRPLTTRVEVTGHDRTGRIVVTSVDTLLDVRGGAAVDLSAVPGGSTVVTAIDTDAPTPCLAMRVDDHFVHGSDVTIRRGSRTTTYRVAQDDTTPRIQVTTAGVERLEITDEVRADVSVDGHVVLGVTDRAAVVWLAATRLLIDEVAPDARIEDMVAGQGYELTLPVHGRIHGGRLTGLQPPEDVPTSPSGYLLDVDPTDLQFGDLDHLRHVRVVNPHRAALRRLGRLPGFRANVLLSGLDPHERVLARDRAEWIERLLAALDGRFPPGQARSTAHWASAKLDHAALSPRTLEWWGRWLNRLVGYSARPGVAIATWLVGAVLVATIVADPWPGDLSWLPLVDDRLHDDVEGAAWWGIVLRLLFLPVTTVLRIGSSEPVFAEGWVEVVAAVLLGLPFVFALVGIRSLLQQRR